jgi:hypothetical protein
MVCDWTSLCGTQSTAVAVGFGAKGMIRKALNTPQISASSGGSLPVWLASKARHLCSLVSRPSGVVLAVSGLIQCLRNIYLC